MGHALLKTRSGSKVDGCIKEADGQAERTALAVFVSGTFTLTGGLHLRSSVPRWSPGSSTGVDQPRTHGADGTHGLSDRVSPVVEVVRVALETAGVTFTDQAIAVGASLEARYTATKRRGTWV